MRWKRENLGGKKGEMQGNEGQQGENGMKTRGKGGEMRGDGLEKG